MLRFNLREGALLPFNLCSAARLHFQEGTVSGHRLHKAKQYRERAKRSREVAHWMSNLDTKQHLLETAQYFEALAESEEAEAQRSPHTGPAKPEA